VALSICKLARLTGAGDWVAALVTVNATGTPGATPDTTPPTPRLVENCGPTELGTPTPAALTTRHDDAPPYDWVPAGHVAGQALVDAVVAAKQPAETAVQLPAYPVL
jgi:hypothetical protein